MTPLISPIRALLLWHSPNSHNLGVGALTLANMEIVERAAEAAGRTVEVTLSGFLEKRERYPQLRDVQYIGIDARTMLSPAAFLNRLRGFDLVVDIGGGDSLSDLYGRRRLAYLLYAKALAVATRTPLVLAPQTIGPFDSPAARRATELLVAASAATYARDTESGEILGGRRARRRIRVASDVAFGLGYGRPTGEPHGKVRVGLNVSWLMHREDRGRYGVTMDYRHFVHAVIEAFTKRRDVELVLVPHLLGGEERLSRELSERYGLPEPPGFTDPTDAKSFISQLDVFIGSRMHACVAAVSTGVATLPVAYSRKFAGVFDNVGYPHTLDARSSTAEEAVSAAVGTYDRRVEIAGEATRATALARSKLQVYVNGLTEVMARLEPRRRMT